MRVEANIGIDDRIDEVAVQAAVDGFPMRLRRAEQAEAIRRMGDKYTVEVAAWLVGASNARMVHRIRSGDYR